MRGDTETREEEGERERERRKRETHITRQRKDYKTRCSTCLVIDGSGDGTRNPVMMPAAT